MESDACVLAITDFLHVADEQHQDSSLLSIIDRLQSPHADPSLCRFLLQDNVLYRRNIHPDGAELLLVPYHLHKDVLQQFYDTQTSGHLGVSRTYHCIRRQVFWKGPYRSVHRYVASCELCQGRKKPTTPPTGLLQPIEVLVEQFYRVGSDLLGPFSTSTTGNKWIAVATDYATRYAITRALSTSCMIDVADFQLYDIILKHSAPSRLLTDRGRYFLSRVVDDLLRSCATRHNFTTSYHLQTNGLTECLNRTLTDMLSMYVSSDHTDWDIALPFDAFAYNSSRYETAGYSPFYLLFGHHLLLPFNTLLSSDQPSSALYAQDAITHALMTRVVSLVADSTEVSLRPST